MKVAWLQLSSIAYGLTIQLESSCRTSTGTKHILITSDLVLAVAQMTLTFDSSEELPSGCLTLFFSVL